MALPEVRFFKARSGNSVAYVRQGEGPLVVCPSWWVSNAEKDWGHPSFRRFFARLGEAVTLVRYDRPGVGLSDPWPDGGTLEAEADLLDDLTAELAADRYGLFATSCGGPTAILHAARNPGRVDRICFYGSYAEGPAICPKTVQDAVVSAVEAHWGLGSRAMADIFFPDADRALLDAFARYQRDSAPAAVAAELLRLTYAMDARPFLDRVAAETLVIHRRGDRAIPFDCARVLAAGLAGGRLIALEGRAHPPWVEGDEIAALANAFLRGREVSSGPAPQVASEPAVAPDAEAARLDAGNRCLVIAGRRIGLTPLEFAVMREFARLPNQVVTRDHLLETVWQRAFEGSNRVDAVIRGLRRKLGAYAPSIETVIGHGYRFVGWTRERRAKAEA